jgi:hypothetical protein
VEASNSRGRPISDIYRGQLQLIKCASITKIERDRRARDFVIRPGCIAHHLALFGLLTISDYIVHNGVRPSALNETVRNIAVGSVRLASVGFRSGHRKEYSMRIDRALCLGVASAALALTSIAPMELRAQQSAGFIIDGDDIGGVVTGPKGAEAGVWVIAETVDLPTKFAKMVVTDDQGRYVIPDLPSAN